MAKASNKATGARHTGVVPAFVAAATRTPIQFGALQIRPSELVSRGRSEVLSEADRGELRRALIKRLFASRCSVLLSAPVGVRLAHGWRARLHPDDLALIDALPRWADRPLEDWCLTELMGALQVPLERLLAVLAALEAWYSNPPPAHWVKAMRKHAVRDCRTFGCTNVLRLAGALALAERLAPGQEAIETELIAMDGFRWLCEDTGWFALGDGESSAAAHCLRKVFAVAIRPVGTDEIAAALASDIRLMYERTNVMGMATPPVHVLRELFVRWPWVQTQRSRLLPSDDLDLSNVLSEVEAACVVVIEKADGVACRFDLAEGVAPLRGGTDAGVQALLRSSPIFIRIERGLYALIGRSVSGDALDAARRRLQQHLHALPPPLSNLTSNQFVLRVTASSLRFEQYKVPAWFARQLSGRRHKLYSSSGELLGEVNVNANGTPRLKRHFPEAVDGDLFVVEVCADGLHVQHHRSTPSGQGQVVDEGDLADEASTAMA